MLRGKLPLLLVCLLHAIFLIENVSAAEAPGKAVVFGNPTANLRAGPSIEQPIKAALKEGDAVTIDQMEGDWYRVTTADGQSGYIHESLLKLTGESAPGAPAVSTAVKTADSATKTQHASAPPQASSVPSKAPATKNARPTTPTKAPASNSSPASTASKSPSVLQMMEGHEQEVMIAAAVAASCFILGWFLGGRHALRRDRVRRSRIQF